MAFAVRRQPHVRQMGFTGCPMVGHAVVAAAGFGSDAVLEGRVDLRSGCVGSLPAE